MGDERERADEQGNFSHYRRRFLKGLGMVGVATGVAATGAGPARAAWGGSTFQDALGDFFQDHYQRMTPDEMKDALARIERKAQRKFGVDITCVDTAADGRCRVRLRAEHLQVHRLPQVRARPASRRTTRAATRRSSTSACWRWRRAA